MMVIWMCGGSLKDRKQSENLYSLLGVDSDDSVRCGRIGCFGHLERKNIDDWMKARLGYENDKI